jgi:hypothetical protein
MRAVERRWWWREEKASVATTAKESDGDLESFEIKSKTTRDGSLFIDLKISVAVLN